MVLVVLVAALAGWELAHLAATALGSAVPATFVAVSAGAVAYLTVQATTTMASDLILAGLLVLIVVGGGLALTLGPPAPSQVGVAAVLVMAPLYVGLPLGLFAWLRESSGASTVTWLVAVVAISDSAQYFVGRAMGKAKLAPRISPAKTVEGAVGGLVVAALFGALSASISIGGDSALQCAVFAVALAGAGIVGDLFESFLKRSAGVKDSSALIPGHGGVLDRIDSHLFAAPVFYLASRYLP